jgi:hypothetical protein
MTVTIAGSGLTIGQIDAVSHGDTVRLSDDPAVLSPACKCQITKVLAEREGFEPPVPFRVRRFSRPEPSTTRPPLRATQIYLNGLRTLG